MAEPAVSIVPQSPIVRGLLLAYLRHVITGGLTWLVTHGVISLEIRNAVDVAELASEVALLAGWAWVIFYTRAKAVYQRRLALKLPQGTTEKKLRRIIKRTPIRAIIKQDLSQAAIEKGDYEEAAT